VTATLPGQTIGAQLGTMQLATFANPAALARSAAICFSRRHPLEMRSQTCPAATGMGTLQQGYLENSNVDVVGEFVQMILAQRAYESNSKVVHVADDMYSQINGMIR
jgi:flagellar basal-body rod protein FlgG